MKITKVRNISPEEVLERNLLTGQLPEFRTVQYGWFARKLFPKTFASIQVRNESYLDSEGIAWLIPSDREWVVAESVKRAEAQKLKEKQNEQVRRADPRPDLREGVAEGSREEPYNNLAFQAGAIAAASTIVPHSEDPPSERASPCEEHSSSEHQSGCDQGSSDGGSSSSSSD